MNGTMIPATSISARSISSRRTSVRRRSNGPSKASRSSSSSRTNMRAHYRRARTSGKSAAAARNRHRRPARRATRDGLCRLVLAPVKELPPDEERRREHERGGRDPRVQPQPKEMVRGVDPQQLLEEAAEAVVGDVEGEQRRRSEANAPVEQQQDDDADGLVDQLVEKRRMEGRIGDVALRPVID